MNYIKLWLIVIAIIFLIYISVMIYMYVIKNKKASLLLNILLVFISILIVGLCIYVITSYTSTYLNYRYIPDKTQNKTEIPYVVYKTGPFKKEELPVEIVQAFENIIKNNPKYRIEYFDDTESRNFIKKHFSEDILKAFDKIVPGAYKADLFRYCVLYQKGGIYSDLSQQFKVPFSEIIDHKYDRLVLVKDRFVICNTGIQINFMAAVPKLKIFKEAIDQIVKNVNNKYYGTCMLCPTGPHLFRKILDQSNVNYRLELQQKGNSVYHIKTGKLIYENYSSNYRKYIKISDSKYYANCWWDESVYQ